MEDQARLHNKASPHVAAPYPSLFGKQKGDLLLTAIDASWQACELPWPDGSTMMVLPVQDPRGADVAFCIAKHPVSNAQYRRFLQQSSLDIKEPVGEQWLPKAHALRRKDGKWEGPFYPWRDERYNADQQPVVCVSAREAWNYCKYVNDIASADVPTQRRFTTLPDYQIWDFAAFGTPYPAGDPSNWLAQSATAHYQSSTPALRDETEARANQFGVVDMIGNVWEWCFSVREEDLGMIGIPSHFSLRGGGFLDDLTKVNPFLEETQLAEREHTRHSDLGFRIFGVVPVADLPEVVRTRLRTAQEFYFYRFWEFVPEVLDWKRQLFT